MATKKEEEIKIEAPVESVQMAATPAPVQPVQAVSQPDAYAAAVEASKRTDANGVTTPVQTPAPVAGAQPPVQAPTDYKWNPATGKYETQAQASAPATPAPVTPTPKPEAKKATPAPIDYDASAGREAEINANLNRITTENPSITQDRAKFDAAFGYQTADAGKKALLDSFYDSKQVLPKEDDLYVSMRSGMMAFDARVTKTPEYQSARKRFQDFNRYSSYNPSQLATAMKRGDLIPGSQAYGDLYNDPNARAKLDYAKSFVATQGIDLTKTGEKKTSEIIASNPNTAQAFEDGVITQEEYSAMMSSPEVDAKRKEVETKKTEYDTLKAQYDAIDDEVDSEFKGKGATSTYLAAEKAKRRRGIYKDLQIASDTYNNAVGTLNDMVSSQAKLVEMNMGLYRDNKSFERQKQLAEFQSDLSIETEAKKFEQKMEQQALVAKDPTLATQAVLDQYREMGVLAQRSDAEIVADVQAQVAGGKPLGQVLTDLNKAFQSKSEYKSAMAKKFPAEGTDWEIVNVTKDGVTQSMERNKSTGEIRAIGAGSTTPSATDYGLPAGSFTDLTSTLKRTGNNVGKDTNNPGNIMAESPRGIEYAKSLGAIGMYKSPNGRTYAVFPDMETGKAATMADLKTKLSGGSSWVTPETTLGQFATGWTVGPRAGYNASAANSYAKFSGFSPDTRIKDIPLETLANAVIRHEGVDPSVSADVGGAIRATVPEFAQKFLGAVQRGEFTVEQAKGAAKAVEFSPSQKSAMENYADKPSKDTRAELKAQGVTESQANSYVSALSGEISPVAQSIADGYGNVADLTATEKAKVIPQVQKLIQAKLTGDEGRDAVVKSSIYNKDVSDTTLTKLSDMKTVAMQLDALDARLKGMDTGPIIGRIMEMNPYDTEAQVALAQMAGVTPKVARGIFGEVGVLTDTDIANYQRTLPNLKSTAEKNAAVVSFMKKLLAEGVKNTIETQARGQRNVSEYLSEYDKAKSALQSTKQSISKQSYDALVAKWGEAKTRAYLNAKGFTYQQ